MREGLVSELKARERRTAQKSKFLSALVFPSYQVNPHRDVAKIIALDYAGMRDWSSALVYLEKIMAEITEVSVLNLAAECYLNLPEKALPLLEKSLKLNPEQENIKELEEKTKKRLKNQ